MRNFFKLFFGLLLVVIVLVIISLSLESFITDEEIEIEVTEIEKVFSEDGDEYYLVHTKDEIFENRDDPFQRKINSKDIRKKLKVGKKFHVRVVGYDFGTKIPFFLEHRNILEVLDKSEVIKGIIK